MGKIMGVTHPIPTKYAERIYNEHKTVFVGKTHLGRVSIGDKFIIYESHGAKAYTGWADIKFIGKLENFSIKKKYNKYLMINSMEFDEYSKNRKFMNVIEFENFEKFKKPIIPKRFVAVSGKYIYEEEFNKIVNEANKS